MQHIWTVICEKSITDKENNLISLIGCIEQFNLREPEPKTDSRQKGIKVRFEIISLWFDESTSKKRIGEAQVELYDPSCKRIRGSGFRFEMPQKYRRIRTRVIIEGLPITTFGKYLFKISYKDPKSKKYQKVTEIPVDIVRDEKQK